MNFKEVIRPPIWLLAFIYFLLLSMVVAIWAAFDNRSALLALIALTLLQAYLAHLLKTTITITEEEFRIDRAHIDRRYIKGAEYIASEQMRRLRTRDADPAAYLAFKFWLSTGVKIILSDPRDQTPYWLVNSKRGAEIAALLNN